MEIKTEREYRNALKIHSEARLEILAKYNALRNTVPADQLQRALGPDQCWALGLEDDIKAFEKERGL